MPSKLARSILIVNDTHEINGINTALIDTDYELPTSKAIYDYYNDAITPATLTVGGTWNRPQMPNQAPDTEGLTYTVTFSDGRVLNTTADLVSPTTWGNAAGIQTATFSYTRNGVTVTGTKDAGIETIPTSLTITGSPGPQFINESFNPAGMTFTVTYNDGQTATVNNIPTTPNIFSTLGDQVVIFSYSENSVQVTAQAICTVYKRLKSLTYSGTWGTQRENTAVNTSGITFTATYMDDTSKTVTPDVSPAKWATNNGQQTATFSYTENGVTVSATKTLGMTYNITMLTNESTYGTTSIDTNTYVYSELVQTRTLSYSITNSNIYQFNSWSSEVGSISGDALNIPANAHGNFSVTGNFGLQTFTITVRSNNTSKGTVSGDLTYSYSVSPQTRTVTATPLTNYRFVSWSVSGPSSGTITVSDSTLTIGAGAYGNATVTATFTADSRGWKPPSVQFVFMSRPNTGSYPGILYEDEACERPVTLESKLYNGSNATFYAFKNSRVSYMLTYLSRVTNKNAYTSSNWSDSYMQDHITACRTFVGVIGSNGVIWSNKATKVPMSSSTYYVVSYNAASDQVFMTFDSSYSSYPTYIPINYTMTLT